MIEIIGIVEQGQIKLPSTVHLSEGQSVRVLLDGLEGTHLLNPEDYPREGEDWTEEELQIDLDWAMGQRRNTWLSLPTPDHYCISSRWML